MHVLHPDDFLCELLSEDTDTVLSTLVQETASFTNPPEDLRHFLSTLAATVPMFANLAADAEDCTLDTPLACPH